jgi:hypothetical protein
MPVPGKSGMGMGMGPRSPANRGLWARGVMGEHASLISANRAHWYSIQVIGVGDANGDGSTPDPRQIGDGSPIPTVTGKDGDRGFRALCDTTQPPK